MKVNNAIRFCDLRSSKEPMAKTLAQIESQIAKLQLQAEALRARTVSAVVGQIRALMAEYALTTADLERGPAKKAAKATKAARKSTRSEKGIVSKASTVSSAKPAARARNGEASSGSAAVEASKAVRSVKASKASKSSRGDKPAQLVKTTQAKPAGAIKYRDEAGNTWTGRGTRPKWFLAAVAAGKTPEQLLAE